MGSRAAVAAEELPQLQQGQASLVYSWTAKSSSTQWAHSSRAYGAAMASGRCMVTAIRAWYSCARGQAVCSSHGLVVHPPVLCGGRRGAWVSHARSETPACDHLESRNRRWTSRGPAVTS